MADNVILPASGATVATDDIGGGVMVQRMKLDIGADGASIRVTGGGTRTVAQSVPVAIASDQAPIVTNPRLLTATDQVTLAGGTVNATAFLYDGFGNQIRSVNPASGINQLQVNTSEGNYLFSWSGTVVSAGTTTYTSVVARNFKEFAILANITAVNTGIQFAYQTQDGNGNWVTVWTSTNFTSTGIQYISCGPGYAAANAFSLGIAGRIQAIVTGTSATVTGSVIFRT